MQIENIKKANELVKKREALHFILGGLLGISSNTITINPGYFDQTIIDGSCISANGANLILGERLTNLVAEFKDNVIVMINAQINATESEIKEL